MFMYMPCPCMYLTYICACVGHFVVLQFNHLKLSKISFLLFNFPLLPYPCYVHVLLQCEHIIPTRKSPQISWNVSIIICFASNMRVCKTTGSPHFVVHVLPNLLLTAVLERRSRRPILECTCLCTCTCTYYLLIDRFCYLS